MDNIAGRNPTLGWAVNLSVVLAGAALADPDGRAVGVVLPGPRPDHRLGLVVIAFRGGAELSAPAFPPKKRAMTAGRRFVIEGNIFAGDEGGGSALWRYAIGAFGLTRREPGSRWQTERRDRRHIDRQANGDFIYKRKPRGRPATPHILSTAETPTQFFAG
jgi:hypothetical protein